MLDMPRQGNARMRSDHSRRGTIDGHLEGQPRNPEKAADELAMTSDIHRNSFWGNPGFLNVFMTPMQKFIEEFSMNWR